LLTTRTLRSSQSNHKPDIPGDAPERSRPSRKAVWHDTKGIPQPFLRHPGAIPGHFPGQSNPPKNTPPDPARFPCNKLQHQKCETVRFGDKFTESLKTGLHIVVMRLSRTFRAWLRRAKNGLHSRLTSKAVSGVQTPPIFAAAVHRGSREFVKPAGTPA
jgi:hypothetical protein